MERSADGCEIWRADVTALPSLLLTIADLDRGKSFALPLDHFVTLARCQVRRHGELRVENGDDWKRKKTS